MIFTISCEQYNRLFDVALQKDEKSEIANREFMRSIRLENIAGRTLAVVTCGSILACEYLGETNEPDGSINLIIDDKLREQCIAELNFDSKLIITLDQASGWAVAQTTLGYMHPNNVNTGLEWVFENIENWRSIVATGTKPNKSKGTIAIESGWLIRLTNSSPTKSIIFPERFDVEKAIIITDLKNKNWFGCFLALNNHAQTYGPATVPDWF